jgi:hypothetical protein
MEQVGGLHRVGRYEPASWEPLQRLDDADSSGSATATLDGLQPARIAAAVAPGAVYRLGKGEAKWTRKDGVYSFRNEIAKRGGTIPPGTRVVFFHGAHDPWESSIQQRYPWVKAHYH